MRVLAEVSPVLPPTILPLIQPQHVAGHVMQPRTIGQLLLDVGKHGLNRGFTIHADRITRPKQSDIDLAE